MRLLLICLFSLFFSFGCRQASIKGDTLNPGTYDTTSIEIRSGTSFPFCGTTYPVPRENCSENLPANCCSYSTSLSNHQKEASWGYVSCYNGSSFTWHYNSSIGNAKNTFEDVPQQLEKQQKSFSRKKIKCVVYNQETDAYLMTQESFEGHKSYLLTTYGTHNGFYFYLEYHSLQEIKSTEDLQPVFRQILTIR